MRGEKVVSIHSAAASPPEGGFVGGEIWYNTI